MLYPFSPEQMLAADTRGEGVFPFMDCTFVLNLLVSLCPPADVPPTLGTSLSRLGILKSENPALPADSYSSMQLLCYLEIILDFDHPTHHPGPPSLKLGPLAVEISFLCFLWRY